jgi:hypothetical protein
MIRAAGYFGVLALAGIFVLATGIGRFGPCGADKMGIAGLLLLIGGVCFGTILLATAGVRAMRRHHRRQSTG